MSEEKKCTCGCKAAEKENENLELNDEQLGSVAGGLIDTNGLAAPLAGKKRPGKIDSQLSGSNTMSEKKRPKIPS